MTGLLDWIKTPEGQGLLSAAFGGLAGARRGAPLNSIGGAGMAGLMGYSGALDRQTEQAQLAKRNELFDMQMQTARQQMADKTAQREYIQGLSPTFLAGQTALAGGGGPTVANAARIPSVTPMQQALHGAAVTGAVPISDYLNTFKPKERKVKSTEVGRDLKTGQLANYVLYEDGTSEALPFGVKPNNQMVGLGGSQRVVDMNSVQNGQEFRSTGDPFKDLLITGPDGSLVPNAPLIGAKSQIASAGAARNSQTVINKQEGEEAKTVGKFFGDSYADVQKAGMSAQGSMNRYSRLGQLLENVDTGKFAPLGLEVAKAAQSFGIKIDPNLANKEAAVALSSEIALQLRNPSGGAGMPGALSDADRNFLAGMVPGIEKTPEGRKMILDTARKLAQRDIDVARMAREYRSKKGSIDEGFYDELERYSEANPLFQSKPSAAPANPKIEDLLKKYGG